MSSLWLLAARAAIAYQEEEGQSNMATTKTVSWKTLVQNAEGSELKKKPVVYIFGGRIEKVDSGGESGIYEKP